MTRSAFWLLALVLGQALVLPPETATAQRRARKRAAAPRRLEVSTDRAAAFCLAKVDEFLAREDHEGALVLIDLVLRGRASELAPDLGWVGEASEGREPGPRRPAFLSRHDELFLPVDIACRQALSRLPRPAVDLYRGRCDAQVAELLENAAAAQDVSGLLEIARLWSLSSHADDALDLAGDLLLQQGRFREALAQWDLLLEWCPDTDRSLPYVRAKRLYCLARLGRTRELDRALADAAAATHQLDGIQVAGRSTTLDQLAAAVRPLPGAAVTPGNGVEPPGHLYRRWTARNLGGRSLLGLVDGNRLLLSTADGYEQRRIANGMQLWRGRDHLPARLAGTSMPPQVQGAPAHHRLAWTPGRFLVSAGDDRVHAHDDRTGRRLWSYPAERRQSADPASKPGRLLGAPVASGGWVYVVILDRERYLTLHRLQLESGERVETLELARLTSDDQPGMVLEQAGTLYLLTNCGVLAAVDGEKGNPLWLRVYASREMPVSLVDSTPSAPALASPHMSMVVADGYLVVVAADSDQVMCLDATSGELAWTRPRISPAEYVLERAKDGVLLVSGDVRCLAMPDGAEVWRHQATVPAAGHGLAVAGTLLLPHPDGVCAFPTTGGDSRILAPSGGAWPGVPCDLWLAGDYLLAVEPDRLTAFRARR